MRVDQNKRDRSRIARDHEGRVWGGVYPFPTGRGCAYSPEYIFYRAMLAQSAVMRQ